MQIRRNLWGGEGDMCKCEYVHAVLLRLFVLLTHCTTCASCVQAVLLRLFVLLTHCTTSCVWILSTGMCFPAAAAMWRLQLPYDKCCENGRLKPPTVHALTQYMNSGGFISRCAYISQTTTRSSRSHNVKQHRCEAGPQIGSWDVDMKRAHVLRKYLLFKWTH